MLNTNNYTIVVITATNNTAVAMFANKRYIYKTGSNNRVALLKALKTVLNKVKPSTELQDKPALIVTTQSILKGFTTGSYISYIRNESDSNGNKFTNEELILIKECALLIAEKTLNIRFIDEKFLSSKDTIAQSIRKNAFDAVQKMTEGNMVLDTQTYQEQGQAPKIKRPKLHR